MCVYRAEDIRDALVNADELPDVEALRSYRINCVRVVTFNSAKATKKFAAIKALEIEERLCTIFDPGDQQVKLDAEQRPGQ